MALEKGYLLFQLLRQPGIVRIEERDIRTGGNGNPSIASRGLPRVPLYFENACKTCDDLFRVVGGSVVDDEKLKVPVRL